MMVSILVSYLPAPVKAAFPPLLMPLIGNGFVMGVLAVLVLEHIVYRRKTSQMSQHALEADPLSGRSR